MKRFLQPFWLLLTTSTDNDLRQMIDYLKEENKILRSKLPKQITLTPRERNRLVKFGSKLGSKIRELITIVTYRTFNRWKADTKPSEDKKKKTKRKPGRPKTPEEIRELVLKLARELNTGAARVHGELKKLEVKISYSTVRDIIRGAGLDPGPKRGEGTWSEFIQRHTETLWAADFFSKKVWTKNGLVDVFVLFFIHVGTRRVHVAGMTTNPDEAWVVQQARNVSMFFADQPEYLIMDMDSKFTARFRTTLESDGLEVIRVGPKKPNLNAFAERFVQTIRRECLDHFVYFGVDHLRHIVKRFETFYNQRRPHQGRDNRTLPEAAG